MTLDELKALAEKAKAWRPYHHCDAPRAVGTVPADVKTVDCGTCDSCLGAQRAVEDIAGEVDESVENCEARDDGGSLASDIGAVEDSCAALGCAERAARIASYFCSEPNPVSEFRDAVKEFCR